VFFSFFVTLSGFSQSSVTQDLVEPGVIMVQFESSPYTGKTSFSAALEVQSIEVAFPLLGIVTGKNGQLPSVQALKQVYRVRYLANITPHQAAKMIQNNSGVVYAEPHFLYSVASIPFSANTHLSEHFSLIPDDPLFSDDAYMELMGITEAWEIVKGEDGDVIIAIVDNGVDWEHPDLRANLWENPREISDNGIDDDGNGFIDDLHGWNFAKNTNNSMPLPGNSHGTLVAGVAMAVADNGIGLAGISWNAKFMPINVSCGSQSRFLCNTHEALLYAAINGAHIINASYGVNNYGSGNETESLVLKTVFEMGSLVISTAGNQHRRMGGYNPYYYPASNQLTLSVCGTQSSSYQNLFNYGYTVDVCAAGSQILTTNVNDGYTVAEGTSFSVPLVSGIAALVKTRFPHYTPAQIREQIRSTADYKIYEDHPPSLDGLLGRGYVNAFRAVTETNNVSVRMVDWEVNDIDGDNCFAPSELMNISATFESFLKDGQNLSVELIPDSPHVDFPAGSLFNIGSLRSGETTTIDFSVIPTPEISHRSFLFIEPRIRSADGTIVSGSDAIEIFIHATQLALHETGTFTYTMTSEGNIGFTDIEGGMISQIHCTKSMGEMKLKGNEWMSHAGLLIGTSPSTVTGSVFSKNPLGLECILCPVIQNHDYLPFDQMVVKSGLDEEQTSHVTLVDKTGKLPEGFRIIQESLTDKQNQFEDIALFRYRLLNPTHLNISGLHIGLYFDPIQDDKYGMANYQHQSTEKGFPYVRSSINAPAYVGFVVLSDSSPKHYKTYNTRETWRLNRPRDAWIGLTGGIVKPASESGLLEQDNSQLIGSGPHTIPANSGIIIDFAMIHGDSYADLVSNAEQMHIFSHLWSGGKTISAPSQIMIQEADSSTFFVHLSGSHSENITLTMTGFEGTDIKPSHTSLIFSSVDQHSLFQPVTIYAIVDDNIDDEEVILKLVDYGNDQTLIEHEIHVTIIDNGVGAILAPSLLKITEGETQSFEIALKASPRGGHAIVNITGYEDTDIIPQPTALTFTTDDWNKSQIVKVIASEDSDLSDDTLSLILNVLGGGYSTSYEIPVKIIDHGIGGISALDSISIDEGETELFKVVLKAKPDDYVIISITGDEGTDIQAIPKNMVFRSDNWFISQNVILYSKEDKDASNDELILTLFASGGGYNSVQHTLTVTINDNDDAMISSPTSITIMEGDSESFEISPVTPPTSDVRIILSGHQDSDLTIAPTTINFGVDNWSNAHIITMNTFEDRDILNDEVKLLLNGLGGGYDSLEKEIIVTIIDNLGVGVERLGLPKLLTLRGSYPNPLTEATIIEFDLPEPAEISIAVIDLLGRTVKKLSFGRFDAGWQEKIQINMHDLTSGLYYCILQIEMENEIAYRTQPITVL